MAPVRAALRATHWKKVPNPNKDTGGSEELWTPCDSKDPNAVQKSLMELNGDEVLLPPITQTYFEKSLKDIRPSVSKKELEMQERFTKEFGQPELEKRKSPEEVAKQQEEERIKKQQQEEEDQRELEFMKRLTEWTDKTQEQKKEEKKQRKEQRKKAAAI